MAIIVSTQDGNWGSGSTWTGGTPPGAGDQAQIANAVTVEANKTVGTSGVAGTYAIRLDAGGSLTVASGFVLTTKGDILTNASNRNITLAAGAQIIFDSSAAAGPPVYTINDNIGGLLLTTNGTSGSRCKIDIAASSGNWYLESNSNADTALNLAYTDLNNIGNATYTLRVTPAAGAGRGLTLNNVIVNTYNGRVDINGVAGANWNFTNVTFKNGSSQYSIRPNLGVNATGTRIFNNCIFDKEFLSDQNSHGFDIQNCQFYALVTMTAGTLTTWKNNFVNHTSTVLVNTSTLGTYQSTYMLGNRVNPHYYAFYNPALAGTYTCDSNVYENLTADDTGDAVLADAASYTFATTMRAIRDIVVPIAGDGRSSASPITVARNATNLTASLENCTYHCGGTGSESRGAVLFENGASDAFGRTGLVQYFRSNIAWDSVAGRGWKSRSISNRVVDSTSTGTNGASTLNDTGQAWAVNVFATGYRVTIFSGTGSGQTRTITSNTVTQLTVNTAWSVVPDATSRYIVFVIDLFTAKPDYNGGFNFTQGTCKDNNWTDISGGARGYDSYSFSDGVLAGAHDVSGDPQFLDSARNISKWDTSLGGPGTSANAIAQMKKLNDSSGANTAYTPSALVAYVRAGFKAQNKAYKGTGYNGADIGAIPFSGGSISSWRHKGRR